MEVWVYNRMPLPKDRQSKRTQGCAALFICEHLCFHRVASNPMCLSGCKLHLAYCMCLLLFMSKHSIGLTADSCECLKAGINLHRCVGLLSMNAYTNRLNFPLDIYTQACALCMCGRMCVDTVMHIDWSRSENALLAGSDGTLLYSNRP